MKLHFLFLKEIKDFSPVYYLILEVKFFKPFRIKNKERCKATKGKAYLCFLPYEQGSLCRKLQILAKGLFN